MTLSTIQLQYDLACLSAEFGPSELTEAMTWVDVIADCKTEIELLEAQLKSDSAPLKAQLAMVESQYKSKLEKLKEIELKSREQLQAWMESSNTDSVLGCKANAQLRTKEVAVIQDEEALPRECMVADQKKIEKYLKAGLDVTGASLQQKNTLYVTRAQ